MLHPFLPPIENPSFNVVMEGASHSTWESYFYKLTNLEVSSNTTEIVDSNFKFSLIGQTDFLKYLPLSKEISSDIRLFHHGNLGWVNGLTIPVLCESMPSLLERPRTIITRDGRIFSDKLILHGTFNISKKKYSDNLDTMCTIAGAHFFNPALNYLYQKFLPN